MRKGRTFQEMREISFEINVNLHAEGSCLAKFGNTHVLCTASIDEKNPPHHRAAICGQYKCRRAALPLWRGGRLPVLQANQRRP